MLKRKEETLLLNKLIIRIEDLTDEINKLNRSLIIQGGSSGITAKQAAQAAKLWPATGKPVQKTIQPKIVLTRDILQIINENETTFYDSQRMFNVLKRRGYKGSKSSINKAFSTLHKRGLILRAAPGVYVCNERIKFQNKLEEK